MEVSDTIKALGFVKKKERISRLEYDYPFDVMILEDLDPFPGFYDHFHIPINPDEFHPRSIFIPLRKLPQDNVEQFHRTTSQITGELKQKFNATMATMEYRNGLISCIRVYMKDYSGLPDLVKLYSNSEFEFLPTRSVKPYISLITVRKHMDLTKIADGIYKSNEMPHTYMLLADKYVPWKDFEKITEQVRNNVEHKIYDAAQAGIYTDTGITEMIRIFDMATDLNLLTELRNKYNLNLNRHV